MEFARLPTDNLYKFLALTGVAIVFVSFLLPMTTMDDIEFQIHEVSLNIMADSLSAAQLQELTEFYGRLKDVSKEDLIKLLEMRQQLQTKRLKTKTANMTQAFRASQIRRYLLYIGIGSSLGLGLACWGFLLWYQRLQKPQDEMLQCELQKSRAREPANGASSTYELGRKGEGVSSGVRSAQDDEESA